MAANEISGGKVTQLGIGLVFGFIVLAMIYTIGRISGAHMNPAVTFGFLTVRRMALREAPFYWLAQLTGALLASYAVKTILPNAHDIGATIPLGAWSQGFMLEFALSFILMFVIMGVAHDNRAEGMMAGVAIGATIALEAIFAGPISGASMNPARSIGPAIVSQNFHGLWIYCLAPILGTAAGALLFEAVKCQPVGEKQGQGCC